MLCVCVFLQLWSCKASSVRFRPVSLSGFLQKCLDTQVLVILEQGPRLELREVVIQALELPGATLDSLERLEEGTPGSSLVQELLGEDTQGLVHLGPLVLLVATLEQVLQVEDIQALVPLVVATLVQEVPHRELPKVVILEALQVATLEVQEATLQVSKVLILEQQHLRLSTLRSYQKCTSLSPVSAKLPPFTL